MPVLDAAPAPGAALAGVPGLLPAALGFVGVPLLGVEDAEVERPEMPPKSWSQPDMLLPNAALPPVGVRLAPEPPAVEAVEGLPAPAGVDAPPGPVLRALLGRNADACGFNFVPDDADETPGGLSDLSFAASMEARIRASADMALDPGALDGAEELAVAAFFAPAVADDDDTLAATADAQSPDFLVTSVPALPFRVDLPLRDGSSSNSSSVSRAAASSRSSSSEAASTISSSSSASSL